MQNQLNAFLKEKENIISRFRSQGINIEEFESIMNKFQAYQEKILLSKQKYEEAQQLEQNVVQDKQNRMDQLRQLVDKYNNLGVILRFIPSTAPLASNTNYALEVDASLLQQGSILNQDPYIVKPLLKGLQKEISNKMTEIGKRKNVQFDQMKRKENKLNEIRQSNQQKQQIIEKNKQQFEQRNNELCTALSSLQIELKTLCESKLRYEEQATTILQSNETLKQTIETTKENYKNSKLYSKEQEGKDQQSIMNTVDYIQKHHENIITMANKLAQFAREKQSNAL